MNCRSNVSVYIPVCCRISHITSHSQNKSHYLFAFNFLEILSDKFLCRAVLAFVSNNYFNGLLVCD